VCVYVYMYVCMYVCMYVIQEDEREKLSEIASIDENDLFYEYCIREKRSYTEVLSDFPSSSPPLDYLLQLIPVLQVCFVCASIGFRVWC